MKKIPRKFIFLIIFISIFIICIPIYYLVMYFNTKIDVVSKFAVTENVRELSYSQLGDYKLDVVCQNYDITNDHKATYEISVSDEKIAGDIVDNDVVVKIALTSNWYSQDAFKSSSSSTLDSKKGTERTFTINGLDIFNNNNFLLPNPKPTLYVLLTYSVKNNGVTTKYNDIISYPYGSYQVLTGGYN